jgi:hypothetical protein
LDREDSTSALPGDPLALKSLGTALRDLFSSDLSATRDFDKESAKFRQLPTSLLPVMHPSYLPALSEAFSRASHDGPLDEAVDIGKTLNAFYQMTYPPNFPLIGACYHN